MTRVSPPEEARELPGPHASTSVTRAPERRRDRAVWPPKAPAPTTATCSRLPRPGPGAGVFGGLAGLAAAAAAAGAAASGASSARLDRADFEGRSGIVRALRLRAVYRAATSLTGALLRGID